MANLRPRPGMIGYGFWACQIWILGMWAVPYPKINISLALKINILLNYWIISKNTRIYIYIYIYIYIKKLPINPLRDLTKKKDPNFERP